MKQKIPEPVRLVAELFEKIVRSVPLLEELRSCDWGVRDAEGNKWQVGISDDGETISVRRRPPEPGPICHTCRQNPPTHMANERPRCDKCRDEET